MGTTLINYFDYLDSWSSWKIIQGLLLLLHPSPDYSDTTGKSSLKIFD